MPALAVAATLLASCSALERQVSVSPTPWASPVVQASARPAWIEDLTFSGGLAGTLNQVVAGSAGLRTICTGQRAQGGTTWVLTLFGPVAGTVYGVQATVGDYRGPGRYRAPDAGVQVFSPDDSVGWQSLAGDPVSMVLEPGLESGTVDATLTNLTDGSSKVHVSGRWTCQT
jgi:hypothetical protein